MSFYIKKFPFIAEEIANEDEAEIRKRVEKILADIKGDAESILNALGGLTIEPQDS